MRVCVCGWVDVYRRCVMRTNITGVCVQVSRVLRVEMEHQVLLASLATKGLWATRASVGLTGSRATLAPRVVSERRVSLVQMR